MATDRCSVDIVVAVCNEVENLPRFVDGLSTLQWPEGCDYRILFIEDSSTDGTRDKLRELADIHEEVDYVLLVRGHGQVAALLFGLKRSGGDCVIAMDVDGGHPVEVIPEMVGRFLGGADVVQGVRMPQNRRPPVRRLGAWTHNLATRVLTGVGLEKQNVYFRLLSKEAKSALTENTRWSRFLRLNFSAMKGKKIDFVPIHSADRAYGESKFTITRLVRLSLDGILAMMSPARMTFWAALGLTASVLVGLQVGWLPAILLVLTVLLSTARFVWLSRFEPDAPLEVRETSLTGATHAR
ncbi:MAG: glycosyltransferase [Gemmatimonadetes bacterium]|nr:glycosyltransferase [Gemmatimonadota bacterium]